ncbi:hypothetical protein [Daejeonella oryzae]|uniref:hypothetical protein n=1 Tax=Daejeonella oryzae TaxID=1122943 RepID=UPI00040C2524|nr:hypothetical protein [Daejeonella oryzae]
MRIIAELPHPECKITIFSMNQKYLIKLEKGAYEQTYKLSEIDITDGVNGVFKILDDEFMKTAGERFAQMRSDFNNAFNRYENQ